MKYNPLASLDRDIALKKARLEKGWQKVFAWFPAKINNRDFRWLEFVERRWTVEDSLYHHHEYWKYRAIEKEETK